MKIKNICGIYDYDVRMGTVENLMRWNLGVGEMGKSVVKDYKFDAFWDTKRGKIHVDVDLTRYF